MATFITSNPVGSSIGLSVRTSTGYWKSYHNGIYSSRHNQNPAGQSIGVSVTNPNGEFTIAPCSPTGVIVPSGIITSLRIIGTLTSFNVTAAGLTGLTSLGLGGTQLTSFDGTGLSSLTTLYLNDNQLTSLDGFIFPTSLTNLDLQNNLFTSFDGTGLGNLNLLNLGYNLLTSFNATGLTGLTYLNLINSEFTSPSTNNQILNQLNQNGLSGGTFEGTGDRTSASNVDYINLVNNLGWTMSPYLSILSNGKLRLKGVNSGI